SILARINRVIAIVCGIVLLGTAALILVEVTLRRTVGGILGGTDEISGYVMAGIAAWGFAYALLERAHVRIDLLHGRLSSPLRAGLDLLSMGALAAVATLVSWHGWRVLLVTLDRGSRANTPLETPLWIPQTVWVLGWTWFALCAIALVVIGAILIARGERDATEAVIGLRGELESAS
ncbi:MAG: TRAP transporter small permease, partial [Pseudomonadota bacterium]